MSIVDRSLEELDDIVEVFYQREARALQAGDLETWLSFLSEDIQYRVYHSASVGREDHEGEDGPQSFYYDEDLASLRLRIRKLGSMAAWTESPKSRRRYFWQTLAIERLDNGRLQVFSNIHVSYIRGESQQNQFIGGREDLFSFGIDGLQLLKRDVELDQTLVTDRFLNTFF